MVKRTTIKANIPVIYLKEGKTFICYSPAFDRTAHGNSFEDAEQSFAHTLKLFIEHVSKKGTGEAVLRGCRWEKLKHAWNPPRVISQERKEIEIPSPA